MKLPQLIETCSENVRRKTKGLFTDPPHSVPSIFAY
jgi:hypothetical protein